MAFGHCLRDQRARGLLCVWVGVTCPVIIAQLVARIISWAISAVRELISLDAKDLVEIK